MARSKNADIADRIPLLEIMTVEEKTLLYTHDNELEKMPSINQPNDLNKGAMTALNKERSLSSKRHMNEGGLEASQRMFEVFTADGGLSNGRTYVFRCRDYDTRREWIDRIQTEVKRESDRFLRENHRTEFYKVQRWMKGVYDSELMMSTGAVLVLANFVVNICQFELLPEEGTQLSKAFYVMEEVFTILFAIELSMNMIANWWAPFWSDPWNILDFVVVVVSAIAMGLESMPGVNVLRLMRVFRVVRLFKRLESLRTIVESLSAAVVPVANAFFVLILVASLYAVLAVMLFGEMEGQEQLFGRFSLALFTMIQVTSGDGWVTDIVRPMHTNDQSHDAPISFFFTTYYIVTGIVMLNVVVAVLLDEFVNTVGAIKESQNDATKTSRTGILDPLLEKLAHFNTSSDLSSKINAIYQMFDADDNGRLTYEELADGLRKLTVSTGSDQISLLPDEFQSLTTDTTGASLLDKDKSLTKPNFDVNAFPKRAGREATLNKWSPKSIKKGTN